MMIALSARKLPRYATLIVGISAIAVATGLCYGLGFGGPVLTVVLSAALFILALYTVARIVEGRRPARDRTATALIYGAFLLALIPLISVAETVVTKGMARLDGNFYGTSMNNISAFDAHGGAYHAIIGTLEQVGIATLITVPLGIAAAIYIVEYGKGKLATLVRFFIDVMTGIPSIVAGLFVLAFWVLIITPMFSADGEPVLSGFAAALALSVLMLPTVVRATEEMLRLVPDTLREGAYALGVPKWKTITKIVLPTAVPGIVTGVMLAVARAAGETAPVLLVAGAYSAINFDPLGPQSSLALFVFDQATDSSKYATGRAWTAALTLVLIVLTLTIAAKLLARRSKLTR